MVEMIIQAENILKSYSNGDNKLKVLNHFNLNVYQGEIITIMGQSGSGKSTALNILGTLDNPDSGKIIISGNETAKLSELHLSDLRNKHIGFVFQFHHLLPEFTAIENILMPLWMRGQKHQENNAHSLMDRLGLLDRKDHLPSELSGGERSRVAVIRALINDPSILLADEPTGNLYEKNANKLIDLLIEINKDFKQTIVLTTHNPKVAEIGHRKFSLENGSLIQQN